MGNTEKKRTKDAPDLIGSWIKAAATIPFTEEFPAVKDSNGFELKTYDDIYRIYSMDLRDLMQNELGSLSKDFLEYIWGKNRVPEWSAHEEIKYLGADRTTLQVQTERAAAEFLSLRLLWNQFKILTKIVDQILTDETLSEKEIERMLDQLPIEPRHKYNKRNGKTDVSFDLFTQEIRSIDIKRIRECKWCHRVFWAGKSNQLVCPSVDVKASSQNNKRLYDCGHYYNIKKFGEREKRKNRQDWLEKLQGEYIGKVVKARGINFNYIDSKPNQPNKKELNGIPIKITGVVMNNQETETTYKFFANELNSKRDGYLDEFKYNSRLKDNLDRHLEFK